MVFSINLVDEVALIALKAHITYDSQGILATNWSTKSSYCSWYGISCNAPQQRVSAINLSNMGLQGTIVPQVGNLSFLVSLDLSNNYFHASLPKDIGKILLNFVYFIGKCKELQQLNLFNNKLVGSIPICNLSKLEELYLGNNQLTGEIPKTFSHLRNLKILSLRMNNLTGSIPATIFNISSLLKISLSYNSLSGSLPMDMCNTNPKLKELNLTSNHLSGKIPTGLGQCTKLQGISLSYNEFTGSIPRAIGNLVELQSLSLHNNSLTGEIPQSLFKISSLRFLRLGENNLVGILPTGMGYDLPKLEMIDLSINQFKGEIPSSLSHCRQLRGLSLSLNQFTGGIPQAIGSLSNLEEVYLAYNNLAGGIPREIGNLSNLNSLQLGSCGISGPIPPEIFNISSLQRIDLTDNSLHGSLPMDICKHLHNLQGLYLSFNQLSGQLPTTLSLCGQLLSLSLWGNRFTVGDLINLQNLKLSVNNLTGIIPEAILTSQNCRPFRWHKITFQAVSHQVLALSSPILKELTELDIWDNFFTGDVPKDLGNLRRLEFLNLGFNQLTDEHSASERNHPTGIGNLINLIDLRLNDNDLTGLIPISFGHLQKLQWFALSGNRIHGSIPSVLCHLRNLGYLDLSLNKLSGTIPGCFGNLTALRNISLHSNGLASEIPSSLWTLRDLLSLLVLDLSKNQFSGNIPSTISLLQNLLQLYLSHNKLQGHMPPNFGALVSLEYLDLSGNNFSGTIPTSLEALKYLKYLNVSFNKLQGEIPNRGPFANFTAESFISNLALCGAPRFQVMACEKDARRNTKSLLLKCIVPLSVSLSTMILVVLFTLWKRRQTESESPVQVDLLLPRMHRLISHQELLYATSYFGEENLIGKGSLGMVYKGVLSDGLIVAVKVFNLELHGAFKSFEVECEVMRNIRHRNLAKIISSCSNLDFKALVLEYMPNESLEKWLYSHNYCLDFIRRLKIMIDVASGLEYLHHDYSNPVVHCDLKPSNVLLDDDMVAHISDFGIAKLLMGSEFMKRTKTLGTIGYMASGKLWDHIDGNFVRKKPTDEIFMEELTLKSWVESSANNIMEFCLKTSLFSSIMTLALDCTIEPPEKRINMKDVVARLKKILNQIVDVRT
ncbi:hypothetical protein AAG906_040106 [Vitis piasezkii]